MSGDSFQPTDSCYLDNVISQHQSNHNWQDFQLLASSYDGRDTSISVVDILQKREIEELETLQNQFFNNLCHELRTPITSISLAAQTLEVILKKEGTSEHECSTVNQIFQILHRECQRQIKLVNNLLTLIHFDTQVAPQLADTIDLQTWIPSIAQLFKERICQQQQQLYILTTSELPTLTTDICDLEQIFIELLTNACKYTPVGKAIVVSAYATVNAIQISVSNSGIEISAEEQTRIFDAFYRIPDNDPWQQGGSGLGLALVDKLVKRLGASIQLESTAGNTTFTVHFPRQDGAEVSTSSKSNERIRFLSC